MKKLDANKHAIASLSILIMSLLFLYAIIVQPAISSRTQFHGRYEELQFQFNKLGDTDRKSTQLKKELDALRAEDTDKSDFFEYKAEALAAADLQKYMKILIESSQANLISTQVIQQKEVDIFPQVSIKVHLRGNIEALRTILYRLNTDRPVLFIDNLLVQKRHSSGGRRAQRGADQLEVRFDLTGFMYQLDAA